MAASETRSGWSCCSMYAERPIRRTRSTPPGRAPNPVRLRTWRMVLSSEFCGTADEGFDAPVTPAPAIAQKATRTPARPNRLAPNDLIGDL